MQILDLDYMQGKFGLLIHDKNDHRNCILLKFDILEKLIRYFSDYNKRLGIVKGKARIN